MPCGSVLTTDQENEPKGSKSFFLCGMPALYIKDMVSSVLLLKKNGQYQLLKQPSKASNADVLATFFPPQNEHVEQRLIIDRISSATRHCSFVGSNEPGMQIV